MNRKTSILSGNFSANGNYSGYDAQGERIFIHKRQMAAIKWEKDGDVKFPFYAIVGEKTISPRDADGNISTTVTVQRLQALSVFTTQEALIAAANADAKLDIAIKQDLRATATSAGLTEAQVTALLDASI